MKKKLKKIAEIEKIKNFTALEESIKKDFYNFNGSQNFSDEEILLVKKIASSYRSHYTEDLIQEGFLGILQARRHFNENLGVPFLPYASYWIKKLMLLYLEKYHNNNAELNEEIFIPSMNASFYSVEEEVCKHESVKIVHTCISSLPSKREKVALNYLMGLEGYVKIPSTELSQMLGVERSTVSSWLVRGKATLSENKEIQALRGAY